MPYNLTLVGGHLGEQSLGDLCPLHFLLNLLIDPRRNVHQQVHLQRQLRTGHDAGCLHRAGHGDTDKTVKPTTWPL